MHNQSCRDRGEPGQPADTDRSVQLQECKDVVAHDDRRRAGSLGIGCEALKRLTSLMWVWTDSGSPDLFADRTLLTHPGCKEHILVSAALLRSARIACQLRSLTSRQIYKLVTCAVESFLEAAATVDPEVLQLPFGTFIAAALCLIRQRRFLAGRRSAAPPSSSLEPPSMTAPRLELAKIAECEFLLRPTGGEMRPQRMHRTAD